MSGKKIFQLICVISMLFAGCKQKSKEKTEKKIKRQMKNTTKVKSKNIKRTVNETNNINKSGNEKDDHKGILFYTGNTMGEYSVSSWFRIKKARFKGIVKSYSSKSTIAKSILNSETGNLIVKGNEGGDLKYQVENGGVKVAVNGKIRGILVEDLKILEKYKNSTHSFDLSALDNATTAKAGEILAHSHGLYLTLRDDEQFIRLKRIKSSIEGLVFMEYVKNLSLLSDVPSLKYMDLKVNSGTKGKCSLKGLNHLSVSLPSGVKITPESVLDRLGIDKRALTELSLNGLSNENTLKAISQYKNLKILKMNPFKSSVSLKEKISLFSKLNYLSLRFLSGSRVDIDSELSKLTGLKVINLTFSNNKIPKNIIYPAKVESAFISGEITSEIVQKVQKLKNLKYLGLINRGKPQDISLNLNSGLTSLSLENILFKLNKANLKIKDFAYISENDGDLDISSFSSLKRVYISMKTGKVLLPDTRTINHFSIKNFSKNIPFSDKELKNSLSKDVSYILINSPALNESLVKTINNFKSLGTLIIDSNKIDNIFKILPNSEKLKHLVVLNVKKVNKKAVDKYLNKNKKIESISIFASQTPSLFLRGTVKEMRTYLTAK